MLYYIVILLKVLKQLSLAELSGMASWSKV